MVVARFKNDLHRPPIVAIVRVDPMRHGKLGEESWFPELINGT
jgi:hypothetical protein